MKHTLRHRCSKCGGTTGTVTMKGGQARVDCDCGAYQYFAPRTEYDPKTEPPKPIDTGILIYFDGACEPVNPGGTAAAGWLIFVDGTEIERRHEIICKGCGATNNVAEWCGLGKAIRSVVDHGFDGPIVIRGDSQLVIFQLTQKWACNKPHLRKFRDRCLELLKGHEWRAEWIPREFNAEADGETSKCYPPGMVTIRERQLTSPNHSPN